jgi:chemotaxis response regulator CheB
VVRFVLCDEDQLIRSIVESIVTRLGHEVVGVAETTAAATQLISYTHPDAVICDLSLGFNTDYDVVQAAISAGARPIVFSKTADAAALGRYAEAPVLVRKPDLTALEHTLERLVKDGADHVVETERRRRPTREAVGPEPIGLSDAQAFYEALNNATEGDALLSIDGHAHGERAAGVVRGTDRLLVAPGSVKVFLAAGGEAGIASFLRRLDAVAPLAGAVVRAVVVEAGEAPSDAFDRLKHAPSPSG